MRRFASAMILCGAAAASGLVVPGCTDVGDSSALPDDDADLGPGADAPLSTYEDASPEGGSDGGAASAVPDASAADATTVSASVDADTYDTGAADDATSADTGSEDGTVEDTGAPDSTVGDSGLPDTGGAVDSGFDSGRSDGGTDAGKDSGSGADAGQAADAGADAGGVVAACIAAGQTNCVQCQGSTGGVCTPTEALVVQYDITHGFATSAGADPATSCYTCLFMAGGLDDVTFGDTNHECGDLAGSANQAECLTTIGCILRSSCAKAEVSACYCGTAPVSGSCTSGGANGSCDNQEAAGLGFAESDGLDILKNFTATTLPSGVANNIFQNALSNSCSMCVQ